MVRGHLYREEGEGDDFGLYPKEFLSLELAAFGQRVPYMDVAICAKQNGGRYTAIHDKRLDPKYDRVAVIRYPAIDSFLAGQAKYGIVWSQMHRFQRICSRASDFAYNVGLVLHRMESKGYDSRAYLGKARSFVRRRGAELYGGGRSVDCWMARFGFIQRQLKSAKLVPGPFGPRE